MRVRAKYNATGAGKNPYYRPGTKPAKLAVRVGLIYILSLVGTLTALYYLADPQTLAVVPVGMGAVVSVVFWNLPAAAYLQTRLHPVIPPRVMTVLRVGYITTLFTALALTGRLTGAPAPLYYLVLWVLPIFTSFAFFMILRQLVQHGNADRGWLTNTRTFLVSRVVNFAVFPMGQEYHLPHHMYATIPHYRLRELHLLLLNCEEYRREAVTVKGYFFAPERPKAAPTVLDVLGPGYAARRPAAAFTDSSVMDGDRFDDADAVRRGA